ncbi:DUF5677 domain-containing protein [Streptomyces sp. NPDC051956]|uniref:DUF5677 domain-containing protein n=1 Tax=Streptomyces sp. NPDC051956 TaxID=3365677 RepID=UPI0037D60CD0
MIDDSGSGGADPGVTDAETSSQPVQQPPRREILQLADCLDRGIGMFLKARLIPSGQWEAPLEARALSNFMVRNIEAVLVMARTDEVMLPAAWVNARVVFEHAVRILWLLDPDDPMARECRWLGFLADAERSHRLVAEETKGTPGSDVYCKNAQAMREFREGVTAVLPDGYSPQKPPSFQAMLQSIDSPRLYSIYREGSQYVHGSMWGTASYRKHLGNSAQFGEFVGPQGWILPLQLCWLSLRNAGRMLLARIPAPQRDWEAVDEEVEQGLVTLVQSLS